MRMPRGLTLLILILVSVSLPFAAQAQVARSTAATSDTDRLFLSFIEDATLVSNQWWEGQLEFADSDNADAAILRGVVALQPWTGIEVGGRVGFGRTDSNIVPDGTGATDLEGWVKYDLGSFDGSTEFVVGGLVTVPTGDDSAGLGFDAFSIGGFGALRHRTERTVISANAGLQVNGDGNVFGSGDIEGEVAPSFGVGVIVPLSDQVTVVGELGYRSERFEGFEEDSRLLGGVNWRPGNRGIVRAALGLGLDDGAPDLQLIVGYAANF